MAKVKAVSLATLVAATLADPGYMTLHPDSVSKLVASGDATVNPNVAPNDKGEVQVKATAKALAAAQTPVEAPATDGDVKYAVELEYEAAPLPKVSRGRQAGGMKYPFEQLVLAGQDGPKQFFVVGADMKKFSTTVGFANRKFSSEDPNGEVKNGPHGERRERKYDRKFMGKNDVNGRQEKGVRVWRIL